MALPRIPWNFPALCWLLLAVAIAVSLGLECQEHQYLLHGKCCSDCAPGQRMRSRCTARADTVCSPCQDGYFSSQHHHGFCRSCTVCNARKGSVEVKPCEKTSDRVCVCQAGWTPAGISGGNECSRCPEGTFSRGGNGNCQPWTNCSFFGKSTLRAGTATEDALCSNPGLEPTPTEFPKNRAAISTEFLKTRAAIPTELPKTRAAIPTELPKNRAAIPTEFPKNRAPIPAGFLDKGAATPTEFPKTRAAIPTEFLEKSVPIPTEFPTIRAAIPTAFPENGSSPREVPTLCSAPGGPSEPSWGSLSLLLLCLMLLMVSGISILLLIIQASQKKTRNGPGRSIQQKESSCRIPIQEEHIDSNCSLIKP